MDSRIKSKKWGKSMRFTKVSDTVKSKILILFPAYFWVITAVFRIVFGWDIMLLRVVSYLSVTAAIVYVMAFWETLIQTFLTINKIENWRLDRKFFETEANGKTLEEAEEIITSKIERFGKVCDKTKGKILPVAAARKCFLYMENGKEFREEFALLYKADFLDEKTYEQIVNSSKVAIKQNHAYNPFWFLLDRKKEHKSTKKLTGENSSVAGTVIIICNSALQDVEEWVRRGNGKNDEYQILPCVCTMKDQKCYFDSHVDYGVIKKSKNAHNRAIKIIKKVVFGGSLPYLNNENYVEKTYDERYEAMSLYELFAEKKKDIKEDRKNNK